MRRTSISTSSRPRDAQVRQAQRTGGHAAARQVDRAVAGALGQQGVVGVDRADDLQRMFFLDGQAEFGACGLLGHVCPFVDAWMIASAIARSVPMLNRGNQYFQALAPQDASLCESNICFSDVSF
jgi:hypothetical protein